VLDEGNPRIAKFTTTVLHTDNSSGPAFFLNIMSFIPPELSLVSPVNLTQHYGDRVLESSYNETDGVIVLLDIVLLVGYNVTIEYYGQMYSNLPDSVNTSIVVELNYTTVFHEGIGLMVCASLYEVL